jgi:hypothetical protein
MNVGGKNRLDLVLFYQAEQPSPVWLANIIVVAYVRIIRTKQEWGQV